MPSQAVFLFDMSAVPNAESIPAEKFRVFLIRLRIVCLRLITECCSRENNFLFGFKFFNSHGNLTQKMDRYAASEVSLESYENLESEITLRYERYISCCKVLAESKKQTVSENHRADEKASPLSLCQNNLSFPSKVLNLALTQILCDYQWNVPEISSPMRNRTRSVSVPKRNFVFFVSSCPKSLSSLQSYVGAVKPLSSSDVQLLLMPSSLRAKFISEANISLIWLDSTTVCSTENDRQEATSIVHTLREALRTFQGDILPLELFSQPSLTPILSTIPSIRPESINSAVEHINVELSVNVPFSTLFSHYIANEFQPNSLNEETDTVIVLPEGLPLNVRLVPSKLSRKSVQDDACNAQSSQTKSRKVQVVKTHRPCSKKIEWCKLVVQYTVPKGFYGCPDHSYICFPAMQKDSSVDTSFTFADISPLLYDMKRFLVLKCETVDGHTATGLLNPVSKTCACLSIYSAEMPLLQVKPMNFTDNSISGIDEFVTRKVSNTLQTEGYTCENVPSSIKPFEMTSLERWFVPNSKISTVATELQKQCLQEETVSKNGFLKRLQLHYKSRKCIQAKQKNLNLFEGTATQLRRSPRFYKCRSSTSLDAQELPSIISPVYSSSQCNSSPSHISISQNLPCTQLSESSLVATDFQDDAGLLDHLRKIYSTALDSKNLITSSAEGIVKTALDFFQEKGSTNIKVDVHSFIQQHFLMSVTDITEKYDNELDPLSLAKKTKEYELQAVLNLELEVALPASSSKCINSVTSLLRALSFIIGPGELMRFAKDIIKENYGQSLHHILIEISDELNIPIVQDMLTASSASEVDSPARTTSTLSQSSILSCRSSSSVSSIRDCGSIKSSSTSASQNSFIRTLSNRQIMVPKRMLRKRAEIPNGKRRMNDTTGVRRSPRLASKKVKINHTVTPDSKRKNVRRNLFSKEPTPSKGKSASLKINPKKKKFFTPKGHHTLKTKYVPETPSPKQRGFSLRSKQTRLGEKCGVSATIPEVMESPVIPLARKDSDLLRRLNALRRNGSFYSSSQSHDSSSVKEMTSNSPQNDGEHSQQKSSLLSEILQSPSPSVKRCSKRLFQSNTPLKDTKKKMQKTAIDVPLVQITDRALPVNVN